MPRLTIQLPRLALAAGFFWIGAAVADDAADKAEMFDAMQQHTIEIFCQDNSYLTCVQISSEQCATELPPVFARCKARIGADMPDIAEENLDAIRVFWERFGRCVAEEHVATGNFDRAAAEACLDPT
jgi:hypothetical protein